MKKRVVAAVVVIAALSILAVAFARVSNATTTTTTTLSIANVRQEGYGTWFDVTPNAYTEYAKEFWATTNNCSGSVGYDDGQTRPVETSDDGVARFMGSRPILDGDVFHKATSISMRCDWTHRFWVNVRVMTTDYVSRNAAGYYKKVGPGRAYEYLPGTLTIDNRRSSRPTTVYWKIRHPRGRVTSVWDNWTDRYSTPGAHPSGWTDLTRTVVLAWIKVSPHMMFTVNYLGARYRHSVLRSVRRESTVYGNANWTAP